MLAGGANEHDANCFVVWKLWKYFKGSFWCLARELKVPGNKEENTMLVMFRYYATLIYVGRVAVGCIYIVLWLMITQPNTITLDYNTCARMTLLDQYFSCLSVTKWMIRNTMIILSIHVVLWRISGKKLAKTNACDLKRYHVFLIHITDRTFRKEQNIVHLD